MPNMMVPKYPPGTSVIHEDNDYYMRGTVSRAKRVKGTDFFTYDVIVTAWRRKDEAKWRPYSLEKFDVSDYSLDYDT